MAALYGFHFKWIYLLDLFCLIYVTFCTCEIDDDVQHHRIFNSSFTNRNLFLLPPARN